MTDIAWGDLGDRGFLVVRNFLQPSQVEALANDFLQGEGPERYPFGFKPIGRRAMTAVSDSIEAALARIRVETDLLTDSVNFLTLSHYVAAWLAQRPYILHQDFDLDFRLTGDHRNYLNFWIPIIKPRAELTNVAVLPMDRLFERSPEAYHKVLGGGGQRWVPEGGRTAVYGDRGTILEGPVEPLFWLDLDLEELMETPHLQAGDLLLMRGDVIHRTQDLETRRVAASIRATSTSKVLSKERASYATGDAAEPILKVLARCFEKKGKDQVTIGEFLEFAQGRA
jgi:hypothetical protein